MAAGMGDGEEAEMPETAVRLGTGGETHQRAEDGVAPLTPQQGVVVADDQKPDGAPSVRYDSVVVLASEHGPTELTGNRETRDFVSDAFAPHGKFIGYTVPTMALLSACRLDSHLDDGFVEFGSNGSAGKNLLARCHQVRYWAGLRA